MPGLRASWVGRATALMGFPGCCSMHHPATATVEKRCVGAAGGCFWGRTVAQALLQSSTSDCNALGAGVGGRGWVLPGSNGCSGTAAVDSPRTSGACSPSFPRRAPKAGPFWTMRWARTVTRSGRRLTPAADVVVKARRPSRHGSVRGFPGLKRRVVPTSSHACQVHPSEDLFQRFMINDFGHLMLQSNLKGTQTLIITSGARLTATPACARAAARTRGGSAPACALTSETPEDMGFRLDHKISSPMTPRPRLSRPALRSS
jgi:hypothetical protein